MFCSCSHNANSNRNYIGVVWGHTPLLQKDPLQHARRKNPNLILPLHHLLPTNSVLLVRLDWQAGLSSYKDRFEEIGRRVRHQKAYGGLIDAAHLV